MENDRDPERERIVTMVKKIITAIAKVQEHQADYPMKADEYLNDCKDDLQRAIDEMRY